MSLRIYVREYEDFVHRIEDATPRFSIRSEVFDNFGERVVIRQTTFRFDDLFLPAFLRRPGQGILVLVLIETCYYGEGRHPQQPRGSNLATPTAATPFRGLRGRFLPSRYLFLSKLRTVQVPPWGVFSNNSVHVFVFNLPCGSLFIRNTVSHSNFSQFEFDFSEVVVMTTSDLD